MVARMAERQHTYLVGAMVAVIRRVYEVHIARSNPRRSPLITAGAVIVWAPEKFGFVCRSDGLAHFSEHYGLNWRSAHFGEPRAGRRGRRSGQLGLLRAVGGPRRRGGGPKVASVLLQFVDSVSSYVISLLLSLDERGVGDVVTQCLRRGVLRIT